MEETKVNTEVRLGQYVPDSQIFRVGFLTSFRIVNRSTTLPLYQLLTLNPRQIRRIQSLLLRFSDHITQFNCNSWKI
ncbi:hypothetical protein L1987_59131 [Smallanthus sonchifolius]|uniref:Uncharacterized protein n=1 Tax=Smallanthus sonchifolius TaxID=185202 RepID=A0ACB9D4C7_9ASTR|nr:hypothetical protein L1987_59131 [Smallanthus sonchifolius]